MRTKSLITGCVILFIVVAITAPSFADDAIYACAHKKTGVLRLVSSPTQCLSGETSISWNNEVVVHGTVASDGRVITGTGFTVTQSESSPIYVVFFTQPFASIPDCAVTAANGIPGQSCGISPLEGDNKAVSLGILCKDTTYISDPDTAGYDIGGLYGYPTKIPFTFICVK